MISQHQQLADGRWKTLSFFEQMANIGSEVERTISWKNKGNQDYSRQAFYRAIELLDLSIETYAKSTKGKELVRIREAMADHFAFSNSYHSTDASWQRYFHAFTWAARAGKQD